MTNMGYFLYFSYKDEDKDMVIQQNHLKRLAEAKRAFEQESERTDLLDFL